MILSIKKIIMTVYTSQKKKKITIHTTTGKNGAIAEYPITSFNDKTTRERKTLSCRLLKPK